MKTIIALATLYLSLVVTAPAYSQEQDANYFSKTATTFAVAKTKPDGSKNGIRLGEAMERLSREYNFTYQMAPNTDPAVLNVAFNGTFQTQRLDSMIIKMFSLAGTAVSFNGTVVTIHGQPLPAASAQPAPTTPQVAKTPAASQGFPEAPVATDNHLEQRDKYVAAQRMPTQQIQPQVANWPNITHPAAHRVPVQNTDAAIYVPIPPSYMNPWNEDYYSWNQYCPGIGLCGVKVSPRDAQDPYFWARMNGNRGYGYGYPGYNGVSIHAGVSVGGGYSYNDGFWPNQNMYNPTYAMRALRQFEREPYTAAFMLKGDDVRLKDVEVWVNGVYKNTGNRVNNPRWDGAVKVDPGVPSVVTIRHTNLYGNDACFTLPITPDSMADSLVASFNETFYFEITVNEGKFLFPKVKGQPPRLRGTFNQITKECTLAKS